MTTLRDADADTIRRVLKWVGAFTGKSRSKLLEHLEGRGAPKPHSDRVPKRKAFDAAFVQKLEELIGELRPQEQAFIAFEINPKAIGGISTKDLVNGGPALKALQTWLSVDLRAMSTFITRCTGERGRYLLFRMIKEKISVSEMQISPPAGTGLLPSYVTTRRNGDGDVDRIVRGAIFQSGETIYAIGQIKDDPGIRFSRLVFHSRGDFKDLYGVRTSHSKNLPFSHLIYAYQLAPDDQRDLMPLLRASDPKDPAFKRIDRYERIRELISAEQLEEGGLMIRDLS